MRNITEILRQALATGQVVPAFNIPYLPMMEAVVKAVIDSDTFALIEVARLEWIKFESVSLAAVAEEFANWRQPEAVRLHLDHVPVIDEDNQWVDYLPIFREAIDVGFESVMIDGSRLPLDENIAATRQVVELAHAAGVAVEAELGAVLGHEDGPLPSYDELFTSGRGFTSPEDARRFVQRVGLRLAIGCDRQLPWSDLRQLQGPEESRSAAEPGAAGAARPGDANPAGAARRVGDPARIHPRGNPARHRQDQRRHGDPPAV